MNAETAQQEENKTDIDKKDAKEEDTSKPQATV